MSKSHADYLSDLLRELDDVSAFTAGGREAFEADVKTQKAVIRSYEVVGEISVLLVLLIILIACAACQPTGEVCDEEGKIFLALQANYAQWIERLGDAWGFTMETTEGDRYVVFSSDPDTYLVVVTVEDVGFSTDSIGISGYYYSASGYPSPFLHENEYEQIYMGNNIWCYKRQ